ncbi:MAG: Bax inhibitor-1/YccA family protein [Alphaproteobacteria bacterium]|nr:Bax inhibitor-1/YccA family protein [Alphaproteobacteria bacterium]
MQADIDVGLRQYMLRVYNYMASGLALTGIVAYMVANSSLLGLFFAATPRGIAPTLLGWVAMIAPIGIVFLLSFRVHAMSAAAAQAAFWAYAAINGIGLTTIFLQFTGVSVVRVFFITAATFGAMSLYGYTTKRDLTGMGTFLFAGLIGIVVAGLVNIFLQSPAVMFAISVIGVVVFVGLTAYDTQRIKEIYFEGDGEEIAAKKSIMGALTLYLDFINIFIMLMQLFGDRK